MTLLAIELRRVRLRPICWVVASLAIGTIVVVVSAAAAKGDHVDVDQRFVEVVASLAPFVIWTSAAVGAAVVGADLASGEVARELCVEPRRNRVVAARTGGAALACGLLSLAVLTTLEVAFLAGAAAGPFEVDIGGAWAADTVGLLGRIAAAGALAGAIGASAAFVFRSTGGAIVAVTSLAVAVEPLVETTWSGLAGRSPIGALEALLALHAAPGLPERAAGESVVVALGWVLALTGLAVVLFDRRDIRDPS